MSQQSQPPPIMAPAMMGPDQQHADLANSYYPQEPSDLSGGLPINLDSLRDGPPGSKPFYPYSTLIRYAIKGSPNQKLLLEDIYYAIESRFPYFRTAPNGWKNSVRHNLSLNPCFEKMPRPLTDRGKGSYWTVNDNVDPRTGVHRIRKKKPKGSGKQTTRASEEGDIDYAQPDGDFPDVHYVQQSPMHPDEAGPSRQAPFTPAAYPSFDPNFPMMAAGMRFVQPPPAPMVDNIEVDEHGNVNWHMAWVKELNQLQHLTAEQEKAHADPEWYRMMLFRVRGALMAPLNPNETVVQMTGPPPHMAIAQANPGDHQQHQQHQQQPHHS
ncbi:hypothetical protein PLICRDRAFT_34769 [Plicaturopsis crispa FD-325 SS-3]|nr:hypothetical protein PLICRDRAFT_34769 [Plicaturopsis crispa FD-325 SS-3]